MGEMNVGDSSLRTMQKLLDLYSVNDLLVGQCTNKTVKKQNGKVKKKPFI